MATKFDSRSYSINDFYTWKERGELKLNPAYQRRKVWNEKAKSYLIDTIIRGLPISKIYMREKIEVSTRKHIRDVVDGQQRLSSIFSFLDDGFKISKEHNLEFAGMTFSDLPEEIKGNILGYSLSVDVILSSEDTLILDIFSRLNTYNVSLNKQELRNAQFFGYFKQLVYELSLKYNKFWVENKIFTESQISRMFEAEFTSDLIIFMLDGIKTRNNTILNEYYKKYEDEFILYDEIISKFYEIINIIGNIYGESLKSSSFNNRPQFYLLFTTIYNLKYNEKSNIIKSENLSKLRNCLDNVEEIINDKSQYEKYSEFIDSIKQHTTNKKERLFAFNFLNEFIKNKFQ